MKKFLPVSGKMSGTLVFTFFLFLNAYFGIAQTVTTDKLDYAPGETAIITGTGWTEDQLVDLHFEEDPFVDHIHDYHDIPVNPDGTFRVEFPILDRHLGVTFTLEAKGQQTGTIAVTVFTDAAYQFGAVGLPIGSNVVVNYTSASGTSNTPSFVPPLLSTQQTNNNNTILTVNSYTFSPSTSINFPILNYAVQIGANSPTITTSNSLTLGPTNAPNAVRFVANYGALVASNTTGTYGSNTVTLTSRLYSNYQTSSGISGQSVIFYINGTGVGSASTNSSGIATLNINISNLPAPLGMLDVGDYTVSSSFSGLSGTYFPIVKENSATATLTVNKANSSISVNAAGPFTYNANPQGPDQVTKSGSTGAVSFSYVGVSGTTHAASSAKPANAGSYQVTATVAADDNFNGATSTPLAFTIGKASTTTAVTITGAPLTYTGSAIEPATVTVTGAGGLSLTPDAVYGNNTNAGTANASYAYAESANHFGSSDSEGFTIGKAASVTVVTVPAGPYTYTGSAQTPATVSVTGAGGLNLAPTADYVNNVNAGTATASYTYAESANHLGSSDSEDFTIGKAASVTVVTVPAGPYTYTGSAQTPATVSVTGAGGLSLIPDAVYSNNINAGTANASYAYAESANHLGSSDSEDFTIGKAASVTVVTVPAGPYTYTGSAQTPATVSVTGAGGLSLTPDAVYSNNINAGTANASYTYAESANHLGSSDSEDFTIGKAASVTVVTVPAGPYTYTGSAQTPGTVSVTGAGGLSLTPDAVYSNNINAGTANASYTYAESANHLGSSDSEDFTIGKAASVTVVTVPAGPYTYTGSAQTPGTVSVTGAGGLSLTPDAVYSNNINAGTANASYAYAESANHLGSTDSKNFTIEKATLTITANNRSKFCGQTIIFNGTEFSQAGLIGGDAINSAMISSGGAAASASVTESPYAIAISNAMGTGLNNYNIQYVSGSLTVNIVTLDVTNAQKPRSIIEDVYITIGVKGGVANVSGVLVTLNVGTIQKTATSVDGVATFNLGKLATDLYPVTAQAGGCSASEVVFLPVYDPNGGFITGGGWIDSPAGAMTGDKANVVGKANFGFNAKYKTGKNNTNEVDGNTNFQFKAGDLHFSSSIHDNMQLVISGSKATYTGTGTVNGVGNHKFRVIAIDGDISGGGGFDKFRIMIWDNNSSSTLLYDNKRGTSESSDDATVISGGSIVIHKPKATGTKQAETSEKIEVTTRLIETEIQILNSLEIAPNPMVYSTEIRFSLLKDSSAEIKIFDMNGRLVKNLYSGNVRANELVSLEFNRENLMSGIYICKLLTGDGRSYEKQIVIN